jgi:transposase
MAAWLKERNVESVAMESTGVYWVAPQEVLERHALEVVLVDTRQLARVPGRKKKTDPVDCQWIQRLHSCGLLTGAFRPVEQVCMLRTLVRDKAILVAETGDWLRRMQKSLDQMNVRVHRAVLGYRRRDRDGHRARHRGGRAGRPAVGEVAGSALPSE